MASTAARVVVRQHKQLIKFPNRIKIHRNPNSHNKGPELSPAIAAITQQVPIFKPLNAPSIKATAPVSSAIYNDFLTLPSRFQRKLIPQEEMEYIEVSPIHYCSFRLPENSNIPTASCECERGGPE